LECFISGNHLERYPHPGQFFAKSAETQEKKGVEFCTSAKKCKRVRKGVKKKEIGDREYEIGS
jgi:hypothetical protein